MRVHRKASKLALLAAMTCCFGSIQMTTVWAAEPPAIPTVDLNAPIFTPSVPEEKKFNYTFMQQKFFDTLDEEQWTAYKELKDCGEVTTEKVWEATHNKKNLNHINEADKVGIKNFVNGVKNATFEGNSFIYDKRTIDIGDNMLIAYHDTNREFVSLDSYFYTPKARNNEFTGSGILHLSNRPYGDQYKGYYNEDTELRAISMVDEKNVKIEPTLYITYDQNGNTAKFKSIGINMAPRVLPGTTVKFEANDVYFDMKAFNDYTGIPSPGGSIDRMAARALWLEGTSSNQTNTKTIFDVNNLTVKTVSRTKAGGLTIRNGLNPAVGALTDFHVRGDLSIIAASQKGSVEGLIIESSRYAENNLVKATIENKTNILTSTFTYGSNIIAYGTKMTNPVGGRLEVTFNGDANFSSLRSSNDQEQNGKSVGLHIGDDVRDNVTYDPNEPIIQGQSKISFNRDLNINLLGAGNTGISFRGTGMSTLDFTVKGMTNIFLRSNQATTNNISYGILSVPGVSHLPIIGRNGNRNLHVPFTPDNENIIENITFENELLLDVETNTTNGYSIGVYHDGSDRNYNAHYLVKNAQFTSITKGIARNVYGFLVYGEKYGSFDFEASKGSTIIVQNTSDRNSYTPTGIYLQSDDTLLSTNTDVERNIKIKLAGPTTIVTYKNDYEAVGTVSSLNGKRTKLVVNEEEQDVPVIISGDVYSKNYGFTDLHFTSANSIFKGLSQVGTSGINKITLKKGAGWEGYGYFSIPALDLSSSSSPAPLNSFSLRSVQPRLLTSPASEALSEEDIVRRVRDNNIEPVAERVYPRAKAIQTHEYGDNEALMEVGLFKPIASTEHSLITTTKDSVIDMRSSQDYLLNAVTFDDWIPYGYITTKELDAQGGTLKLDIDPNAMESDKLLVTNDFRGTMKVDIYEMGGIPSPDDFETGVGLVLARTKGEGTLTAHDREGSLFHTHYELGHMASQLQGENIPTFDTDWYLLRRTRLDPGENPTTPVDTTTGMHGATYLAYRNDLDKLLQRMGELRQHAPDTEGLWFRMKQGTLAYDGLFNSDNSYHSYELGYDKKAYFLTEEALKMGYDPSEVDEETMDPKLIEKRRYRGLSLAYTKGSISHDHLLTADISNTDPIIGHGTTRGRSLSLYQVDEYTNGVYVDAIARYSLWDTDMRTPNAEGEIIRGDFDQRGLTLSVEYGRKHKRHEKDKEDPTKEKESDWYLEPQAQLVWGRLGGTSYTLSNGIHVKASSMNSFIGRLGVNLGKEFDNKKGIVYGKLNFLHDFGGKYKATYTDENDTVNINHKFGGSWWQYGFGVSYKFKENMYVYGDVEKNTGHNYHSGWLWNIGIRYMY